MENTTKFELHMPKENVEKVLVCVSKDTKNSLGKLAEAFNLSKSDIVNLAIELFDKNQDNITVKLTRK